MIEKVNITNTDVVEQIRGKLPLATVSKNGLMPAGLIGSKNVMQSVLLCETTSIAVTGSILLAVSSITSGIPNLYFISMGRAAGNTGNPTVRVKVLSGSYNIRIVGKTDVSGKCRIYAERKEYTPVLNVMAMNTVGIVMRMETVADNAEFEDGFEAALI
ncbi:hypothetical protein [uncultured Bacteroides sp.]|uniref:hypothetical protein n=2 Tax=uncultured Bacteroides sp. TaxID=162156 RepID=UPI0026233CE0|nr:hypothetical protein [uncultured Bacteroides sp.]